MTVTTAPPALPAIEDFFPLPEIRQRQRVAMEFFERRVNDGFKDIVIAAPTGAGKSALGVWAGFWCASQLRPPEVDPGAYYLVTQKLLQDQITSDVPRYRSACREVRSIKSAVEYPCPTFGNCGAGARASVPDDGSEMGKKRKKCGCRMDGTCSYLLAKAAFLGAPVSLTNYPFFLAARSYTQDIVKRQLLIMDEAHNVEGQIMRFVDITTTEGNARKWAQLERLPKLASIEDYTAWLQNEYLPPVRDLLAAYQVLDSLDDDQSKEVLELDMHICKAERAIASIEADKKNWVFWHDDGKEEGGAQYCAKPIFGAPYAENLLLSKGVVRLYLSAYPGVKPVFCRALGLDPAQVAWANLASDFDPKKRPVHVYGCGSMGTASKETTLPVVLARTRQIFDKYPTRGLIHCASYELGRAIEAALKGTPHEARIIFPQSADKREEAVKLHEQTEGAVLISPSITEGFDFANDKARWQIIPKIPWPYLGDLQIRARKDADEEWYVMHAFMTLLQACGRICRNSNDWGVTYVLDSDFNRLWTRYRGYMPKWFQESVITH